MHLSKKIIFFIIIFCCRLPALAQWNTDRILAIGKNALYFEDYVLSIQYFNHIIRVKPYLWEPYMQRAVAKIQLGDYQSAEYDCNEAIQRNPFSPQAYYTRGFTRIKLQKYVQAAEDFTKALEFSPQNAFLLSNRALACELSGEYDRAKEDLLHYMQLHPKEVQPYYDLGRLSLAQKDTVAAEEYFDKLIELDKKNPAGWSARALLRLQKKDLDGALSDYDEAIERNSNYVGDFINRGIIHRQKNNFNEAIADYNAAIELDKNNLLAYYNRGALRSYLGDTNNALDDIRFVVERDANNMEARYQKALLENEIGNYAQSIEDYKIIIDRHPTFLPAYSGVARAQRALGNQQEYLKYIEMAQRLEENKEAIQQGKGDNIIAETIIANNIRRNQNSRTLNVFNRHAAQNIDNSAQESRYDSSVRGNVQNIFTDVLLEKNFSLTYYSKEDELRRTNLYNVTIENYNLYTPSYSPLRITNNETALTESTINIHFEKINEFSAKIDAESNNANLYFQRALEFVLIQDYESAIDDFNKAIQLKNDFVPAYFCRANVRYKLLELAEADNNHPDALDKTEKLSLDRRSEIDMEMVVRDYDKSIELSKDNGGFSFAHYNKANLLAAQQQFKSAIESYTAAIAQDADFAEAYFNRGLLYLFTEENEKGLADLSKAGELGIFKVYNLIQRFTEDNN
ncbi:MAG: tetratricopeptide repeat protein [Prevotellaceae bacterium]|jgi:tetratricopeptide (TPR) repeat protein|nr:tetratricopeptide repeat protein [Prevotellaceae bacterium]